MENTKTKEAIIKLLAEELGVEPEDIKEDDSLSLDLHMKPTDLTDFFQKLEDSGFNVAKINLTDIETVEDIIEALSSQELVTEE